MLVGDLTCCVMAICVLMSMPPGYRREETRRVMGDWTGAQVAKRGSGEHDRVTGFNNVIKSDPLSTLQPYLACRQSCWLARELLLHQGILLQSLICHWCQAWISMAAGQWPVNTLSHTQMSMHSSTPAHPYYPLPPHLQATVQSLAGDQNNEMKVTYSALLSAANWTETERISVN